MLRALCSHLVAVILSQSLKGAPDTVSRKVTGLFRVEDAWSRACWPEELVCLSAGMHPTPTPSDPRGPLRPSALLSLSRTAEPESGRTHC